jgi:peroxiredoxin family protein
MVKEEHPLKKVCIICAKGTIEDVYASLVMGNGAVMEGIETKIFFTFFGLDAITKKTMHSLHTGPQAIQPCVCRADFHFRQF